MSKEVNAGRKREVVRTWKARALAGLELGRPLNVGERMT